MNKYKEWFDSYEKILEDEAQFSGLMSHPTMTGSSREFFVNKFLKTFLPDFVHIGSGKIISQFPNEKGISESKQIDIVLFDSNHTYLKSPAGYNLYPVEGTIATIEIKSGLTKKNLNDALDNSLSVIDLGYILTPTQDNEVERRSIQQNLPKQKVVDNFLIEMGPSTYIYFFSKKKNNYESLGKNIMGWLNKNSFNYVPLPKIIACNNALFVGKDQFIQHLNPDTIGACVKIDKTLGQLATHILYSVSKFANNPEKIRDWIPSKEYNDEIAKCTKLKPINLKINS
jgi:hypothetical protein